MLAEFVLTDQKSDYISNFSQLTTMFPLIKKPVNWFAGQIDWLVHI